MTTGQDRSGNWTTWTLHIKVWKLVVALFLLSVLVMWFKVVHQDDEILALTRNEVVTDTTGQRTWAGTFVNTNSRALRDVVVTVDLLDAQNHAVGKARAEAAELQFGTRLELQAPLPADAVRMRIYSVQWRMDRSTSDRWLRRASASALMGPFREPWEFGYVMADSKSFDR